MKLRIRHQLFIVILTANALLALGLYVANSWSFNKGFLSYINQTEEAKLDPMVVDLGRIYTRFNGWNWVHRPRDHHFWPDLLQKHLAINPPLARRQPLASPFDRSAEGGLPHSRPPPRRRPPPPTNSGPISIDPRLLLANAENEILIGNPDKPGKITWKAIVAEDKTVGYLGYHQKRQINNTLDQFFAAQQRRNFSYAAIALIALSALFSLMLAARLTTPITSIRSTLRDLAKGKYSARVKGSHSNEFGDLINNVNTLGATLEKNLESRQRWIVDISHELRTPVAILQGEIEALQDGIREPNAEAMNSLHSEILRLSTLINDLHELTLSDIAALSYRMEAVNIFELIEETLSACQAALQKSQLTVKLRCDKMPTLVNGDRQRLSQLLSNLIQNSLRYTDAGGQLEISIQQTNGQAVLRWEDSSPGVSDEQLPKLFERLYRVEASRNRAKGGSGLGLSILKNIVDAHQGSVTPSRSSLGGLLITVRLSLYQETG